MGQSRVPAYPDLITSKNSTDLWAEFLFPPIQPIIGSLPLWTSFGQLALLFLPFIRMMRREEDRKYIYIYIFNFVVPSVRVGLRWVGFFCFSNWEQKRYKIIVDHIYRVIIDVCNLISESRPMYIFVCSLKFHEYVNSLNWMDFTFFVCFKLLKRQIGRYLI